MSSAEEQSTGHAGPHIRRVLQACLNDRDLMRQRQAARRRFSPALSYGRHFGPPLRGTKQAAVMVLLEQRDAQWSLPLTVRPQNLPDHPGQISFPGGRLEGSETYEQAAVREFCEELGVTAFPGEIVGELSPLYVFNSDYFVRPFVALANASVEYQPCQQEVDRVLHLPLHYLTDEQFQRPAAFSRGRVSWRARAILHGEDHVWGATAIMLAELSCILAHCKLPWAGNSPGE